MGVSWKKTGFITLLFVLGMSLGTGFFAFAEENETFFTDGSWKNGLSGKDVILAAGVAQDDQEVPAGLETPGNVGANTTDGGIKTKLEGGETEGITGSAIEKEPDLSTEPAIEAVYSAIIDFDANGGRGTVPSKVSFDSTEKITLAEQGKLTKDDMLFLGWAFRQDADKADYAPGETVSGGAMISAALGKAADPEKEESIRLYGVWKEIVEQRVTYYIDEELEITEIVMTGDFPKEVPEVQEENGVFKGWQDPQGNLVDPALVRILEDTEFTAVYGVKLNMDDHGKYMSGNSAGMFFPQDALSRAEAAQILYNLIEKPGEPKASFEDVPEGQWYADAVNSLAAMELIRGYGNSYGPDQKISRAEFITLLSRFFPLEESDRSFSDVSEDHWAKAAIASAATLGWTSGYPDGSFKPDQSISRAEVAVLLNRVLKRSPDRSYIDNAGDKKLFLDLGPEHWAYYEIMEAANTHTHEEVGDGERWLSSEPEKTNLYPGFYRFNGHLYLVESETGDFARDKTVGAFTFDKNGRYTTGNEELNQFVVNILNQITTPEMTQEETLRASYNYVRDSYSYLKRNMLSAGTTDWEDAYATEFFQLGKGNCYSFAAAYYHLSKALGYDSKAVLGEVGYRRSPHGWVEIQMDDGLHLFDTELEMAYRKKGNYSYNLYKMTYGHTPFIYKKW